MKAVGWIVVLVLLVLIGAGAYLFLYSGDLIKRGIEDFGPAYLGADVSVDAVDIDIAGGKGSVRNFQIGNPQGFDGPYAMRLVEISLALADVSSELVVIREMRVQGASLAAVAVGQATNFQKLLENVESTTGGTGAESTAPPADESEMKFIVDRFLFTDADVSLSSDLLGDKKLTIPPIELTGVGRKTNGATAVELAQQLMKPITTAISTAAVSEGLELDDVKERLLDRVRDKVPDVDKLKDLF